VTVSQSIDPAPTSGPWPELPVDDWRPTLTTLHLWTQIVGKVRMVNSPWLNHSWSVPLYVNSRGLGTSLVPHGSEGFEIDLDLVDHRLTITTTTGRRAEMALAPMSVADFYGQVMAALADLGVPVQIHPVPNEIPDAIPFPDDTVHDTYVPAHAHALWRALVQAHRVFGEFRAGFRGKASPVHFFWGSFDLAVTRFSGRSAPEHPGGVPNFPDDVARKAYSHEVTSCGFWPGSDEAPTPIFYAYAYPTPDGFRSASVSPAAAFWLDDLGEFALPYEAVRTAADPDLTLLGFLESTHRAAADLADWDDALECDLPHGPDWWRNRPHA
jgi:hypothetical protein